MRIAVGFPLVLMAAIACNPVDPEADFTISGSVANALGASPGSGVTVHVFKLDTLWQHPDNVLGYTDIKAGLTEMTGRIPTVHTASTQLDGRFSITLKGAQVNTEGGSDAAHLAVAFFDGGVLDNSVAAMTSWHKFTDEDPNWDVGTLRLWDGVTAQQTANNISWTWNLSSSGLAAVSGMASFMYAWDAGGSADMPSWAEHTLANTITVPRVVFKNHASPPDYFLTVFSNGTGGSQTYQHRTSLHGASSGNGIINWVSNFASTDLMSCNSLKAGGLDVPFGSNEACDGNMDTLYTFPAATYSFYIDLGAASAFSYVLLYDLGVRNFYNAVVTLQYSNVMLPAVAGDWTNLGQTIQGSSQYEDWLYVANEQSVTARWIAVRVARQGDTGVLPELEFLGDARVVF